MTFPVSDNITSLLGTFLDVQSRRAEIVAGNLANADTPGYVARQLDFNDFLQQAAEQTLAPNQTEKKELFPRVVDQESSTIGIDGNTVDSGHEMATLAEAGGQFMMGSQLLQMRMRTLRLAIREGK
jgi:flagellar basal-body rod protein FlgB